MHSHLYSARIAVRGSTRTARSAGSRLPAMVIASDRTTAARNSEPRQRAGRPAEAPGVDRARLLAVLGAERGGERAKKRPVEAHQALPGARPHARASLTSCVSRRASARATAVPKGVIR